MIQYNKKAGKHITSGGEKMQFAKDVLGATLLAGLVVGGGYLLSKTVRDEDLPELGKLAIDGTGEIAKSYLKSDFDKTMVDTISTASKMTIDVVEYQTRH